MSPQFWQTKKLHEMSSEEWESLCDGCGKCCLVKLEDEDTGELHHTNVACSLLNTSNCLCSDYENRFKKVDDCIGLTPDNIRDIPWLPESCAYLKISKGESLEWWHPLVSGSSRTVHQANISVAGKVVSEQDIPEDELPEFIDPVMGQ